MTPRQGGRRDGRGCTKRRFATAHRAPVSPPWLSQFHRPERRVRPVPDRYLAFARDDWATLRAATPLTLTEEDLDHLRGINERIDLDEVATVYLPLSRLLNLYVSAVQDLHRVSATFLGAISPKVPYVIGVAGSVMSRKMRPFLPSAT